MDDVAELSGVQELADEAHGGHEAVVEPAHVDNPRLLGLLPHAVRLLRRETERLLTQDVLAVPRRLDAGLGVDRVRPPVVEELHAVVGDLLAPVGDRLPPTPLACRLLHGFFRSPRDRNELRAHGHVEMLERLQRARVRLAHEGVAEHGDADRLAHADDRTFRRLRARRAGASRTRR
jgi:hypothetical protein